MVYFKAPTRQLHRKPIAVSGNWSHQKLNQLIDAVIHVQENLPLYKAVLGRMQLTLHATRPTPHGASRLVQAMSAWSVKTRRAPSRYCSDVKVYGHTTTAMHDNEYPPPPHNAVRKEGWDNKLRVRMCCVCETPSST